MTAKDIDVVIDPDTPPGPTPIPPIPPTPPSPTSSLTVEELKAGLKVVLDALNGIMDLLPADVRAGTLGKILLMANALADKDWFLAILTHLINWYLDRKARGVVTGDEDMKEQFITLVRGQVVAENADKVKKLLSEMYPLDS